MTLLLAAAYAAVLVVGVWWALYLLASRPRHDVAALCGICGWRDVFPTGDAAEAACRAHAAIWHTPAPEGVDP